VWREVKIALLARLAKHQTKTKETIACIKGGWSQFGNRCSQTSQLVALKQGITTASSSLISMRSFGDSINSALLTVLLAS